eukprot:scaffold77090_cov67-Phaeocystis_antarctica.AAC.4
MPQRGTHCARALASSESRRPRGQSTSWGGLEDSPRRLTAGRQLLLLLRRVELLCPVGGHLRHGRVDVVDTAREAALARGRLHALDVDVARRVERLLADARLLPARLCRGGLGLERRQDLAHLALAAAVLVEEAEEGHHVLLRELHVELPQGHAELAAVDLTGVVGVDVLEEGHERRDASSREEVAQQLQRRRRALAHADGVGREAPRRHLRRRRRQQVRRLLVLVLRPAAVADEHAVATVEAAQPRLVHDVVGRGRLAVGLHVLVADAQAQPLRLARVRLALDLVEELLELHDARAVGVELGKDAGDVLLGQVDAQPAQGPLELGQLELT